MAVSDVFAAGALAVVVAIIFAIVGILASALLLWVTTKMFKTKDSSFKTAFVIAVTVGVVSYLLYFIPFVGFFLSLAVSIALGIALIMKRYKVRFGLGIAIWLVWAIFSFIAAGIIGAIFAVIFAGALLAGGGAAILA